MRSIGAPIERFLLSSLVEKTYECLAKEAIQRTFPDKEVTLADVGNYVVSLKDCLDEWEIDLKTTEDLDHAIREHGNRTLCRLKVSAFVRCRDDVKEAMKQAILVFMKTKGTIDETVMDETIRATGFTREFILSQASAAAKIPIAVPITPPRAVALAAQPAAAAITPIAKPTATKAKPTNVKYALPSKARRKGATATAGKAKGSVKERILGALGSLHAIGIVEAPRIQLALWSGYSNVNSAGFAKALSQTKKDGLIQYPSGKTVSLTDAGRQTDAAKSTVPPKDNAAVHAQIKSLLKPIQIRMFDLLANGAAQTREDLAAGMGYTNLNSSGYAKSLSGMSSLGLIYYPKDAADKKKKLVQLSSICFPFQETAVVNPDDQAFLAPTPPLTTAVLADGVASSTIPPPLPMSGSI